MIGKSSKQRDQLTPLFLSASRSWAHAFMLFRKSGFLSKSVLRYRWLLHKGVVDRDDKDITGILELLVVDVTGNVGLGARGACKE
jgi:hypothetical protein